MNVVKKLSCSFFLFCYVGTALPHNYTIINRVIKNGQYVPIYVDIYGVGSLHGSMFGGHEVGYMSWKGAGTLKGPQFLDTEESKNFEFNSWDWGVQLEKILVGYDPKKLMEVEIKSVTNEQYEKLAAALNAFADALEEAGKGVGEMKISDPKYAMVAAALKTAMGLVSSTIKFGTDVWKTSLARNRTFTIVYDQNKRKLYAITRE